ncbi:MAG TPA: hypothetical protein VGO53_16600 [Steroidobacteraceae bacterium]|jgi:hypothetical protein|nr:hypothetical protein [Steroidobacteraceae bacterium]
MNFLVVPNEDADKVNEALGRLYAASMDPPADYPIVGILSDTGLPDPDPDHTTRYYQQPRPGVNGTQTAFFADALVQTWLGQTVQTDLGEVTLPSEVTVLANSWFPPNPDDE